MSSETYQAFLALVEGIAREGGPVTVEGLVEAFRVLAEDSKRVQELYPA